VPFIDPANPGPWLASLSASRRRRAEAARLTRRKRAGRGGGAALLAAMTLAAGGAVAQDGPPTTRSATTGSTVVALQRALGVSADGVIGPITRRAIRNYQRNQGLVVDGIAGPATLASLGIAASSAPAKTQKRSSGRGSTASGALARIAQCESGGDPTAVSSTGQYRGKYQFSRATWRDLGGSGDPAAAPESVQDAMAAKLYAQRGAQPWPVCGS
jgi:peptidoglycan hydrolase-like protein with peptidoglycan-binding domain